MCTLYVDTKHEYELPYLISNILFLSQMSSITPETSPDTVDNQQVYAEGGAASATVVVVKEPMAGYPGMLSAEKKNHNNGTTTLIYSAPISDKIALTHFLTQHMMCCSFALCHSAELKKSMYVHLYEDRLEYNQPCSCCYQIYDNPRVIYLDRDIAELQAVPDMCRPNLTHCSTCPTCWDAMGETLMLHGEQNSFCAKGTRPFNNPFMNCGAPLGGVIACPCPQFGLVCPLPMLNRNWTFINHLQDANALKFEIRKVRAQLVARGLATQHTEARMQAMKEKEAQQGNVNGTDAQPISAAPADTVQTRD